MIQSKSIFPTGHFNIHIGPYVRQVICYLSLEEQASNLKQNKMATLQSKAISEQHDFVGKIISDRRKVSIITFLFLFDVRNVGS